MIDLIPRQSSFARSSVIDYVDNLDDYEQVDSVDYADPLNNNAVPFIADRKKSVPFARAANAIEGWIDVYVALGIEDGFGFFCHGQDPRTGEALIHRVYGKIKILKVDPQSGIYIHKKKTT